MPATVASKPRNSNTVSLELNPASGVDVLGDGNPPLLWAGVERDFTSAEADGLLALVNEHGTQIVRIAQGAPRGTDRR